MNLFRFHHSGIFCIFHLDVRDLRSVVRNAGAAVFDLPNVFVETFCLKVQLLTETFVFFSSWVIFHNSNVNTFAQIFENVLFIRGTKWRGLRLHTLFFLNAFVSSVALSLTFFFKGPNDVSGLYLWLDLTEKISNLLSHSHTDTHERRGNLITC